jgi:hypothetical protein
MRRITSAAGDILSLQRLRPAGWCNAVLFAGAEGHAINYGTTNKINSDCQRSILTENHPEPASPHRHAL